MLRGQREVIVMTRDRLSTSTKVWFVALVAAFLAVAGVGLAQG
jgi:cell division protein FtsL